MTQLKANCRNSEGNGRDAGAKARSILLLSRYGTLGASSRVRMFAYIPWLRRRGLRVDVQSLLPDAYLIRKYGGRRVSFEQVVLAYARRLQVLFWCREPRVIWMEKELWPFVPFAVERAFLCRHRCVIDIDDAVFHGYDAHPSPLVRHVLGSKIDLIFKHSTLVLAGSSYLARRANDAKAPWVEVLPTAVDLDSYGEPGRSRNGEFTVGWIGSPATREYLRPCVAALRDVLDGPNSRFVTIGSKFSERLFDRHEQWTWSERTEASEVSKFDVGIMPLPDGPFERGKCGYKLIQYMAAGIPVIASPVGANVEIVRHGENGLLAESPDDWRRALLTLRGDPSLRKRMGEAGRRRVREKYSFAVTGPRVAEWFVSISNGEGVRDRNQ